MRLLDEFLNMSTQGLAGSREKSQSLWDHMVGNISLLVFACLESESNPSIPILQESSLCGSYQEQGSISHIEKSKAQPSSFYALAFRSWPLRRNSLFC